MVTCGDYELERAIGWGRHATFFTARAGGGGGSSSLVIRRARNGDRDFSQAFLRSAADQQAAVIAGCRRLAPVLAFAIDQSGLAYFATIRFETSLAELLDAGCMVDSQFLREIVSGVLGALSELQQLARRAHGNITPGNVLLDAQGRVFLTDLAPSGKDATTADDLFALGTLIYQLVRRSARAGILSPPLEYSPEWTESLGDDAEAWREFTNRLLFKARGATADALKGALADLKSFRNLEVKASAPVAPAAGGVQTGTVRKPPRKRRLPQKIAAVVLILAGLGGSFWYVKTEKKKADVAAETARRKREEREFQEKMGKRLNTLRDSIEGKPAPEWTANKEVQDLFAQIQGDLKARQSSPHEIKSQVQRRLDEWPVSTRLIRLAQAWRKPPREWRRFADDLESASKTAVEETDERAVPIFDRLRDAVQRANQADEIERQWKDILAALDKLKQERTQNPLLPDFENWATVHELGQVSQLRDVPERAASVLDELGKVQKFCKDEWPRVHQERFKEKNPTVPPLVLDHWPVAWVQHAKQFFRPSAGDADRWQKALERAAKRIASQKPEDQRLWLDKLTKTKAAIENALAPDVAEIDAKMIADFNNNLRYPIEKDHEKYKGFLASWRATAVGAQSKREAEVAIAKLDAGFEELGKDYRDHAGSVALIKKLKDALDARDAVKLNFSRPDWVEVPNATPDVAIYKLGDVEVPFIALGTTVAMAAIETPLVLAKISQSGANPPRDGPLIRTPAFDAAMDWIWPSTRGFTQSYGIARYFAPGVTAGDVGKDSCPVTWLTYKEAGSMAEALGGRLPTSEEWMSALNRAGPVRRLRASAWTAQYKQVESWPATSQRLSSFPNRGSFSTTVGLAPSPDYNRDPGAASGASDDRVLWLRSVFPRGDRWQSGDNPAVFHHLIGNAAEWVTGPKVPAIMGGSVVSSPKLSVRQPLPATTENTVAFDVTFRLAVPIADTGEGAGLRKFVQAAAEIQPPRPPPIPD